MGDKMVEFNEELRELLGKNTPSNDIRAMVIDAVNKAYKLGYLQGVLETQCEMEEERWQRL